MPTWKHFGIQQRPWLLCVIRTDVRADRQRAFGSALKELWFVEGQALLLYREVFVCDFNSKASICQHVALYSDGETDHFFLRSSKWSWPYDKQQLGLWINHSMVHEKIFDYFTYMIHTYTNPLASFVILTVHSYEVFSFSFTKCIYIYYDPLDTKNISLLLSPFS